MIELLIARRDGVIKGSDGALYRTVRGRTLAEAAHPAVKAAPQAFMPVRIDLAAEAADPGHLEDDFAEELAAVTTERDTAIGHLTVIRTMLDERGLLDGVDTGREGWLVERLAAILPAPASVTPPRAVTSPKPRKAAAPKPAAGNAP
jgi:hypothetical protein